MAVCSRAKSQYCHIGQVRVDVAHGHAVVSHVVQQALHAGADARIHYEAHLLSREAVNALLADGFGGIKKYALEVFQL